MDKRLGMMTTDWRLIVSGLAVLLSSLIDQGQTGGCVPFTSSDESDSSLKLPDIEGSYVAFMEWWELETNRVVYREDYVDQDANIAAVRIHGLYDPGDIYTFVSDYNTSQLFTVAETSKEVQCTASDLRITDPHTFPFLAVNNKDHISNTPTLLNFGKSFHEKHIGKTKVRGKDADQWETCFSDSITGGTTKVDFYFTADGWMTSTSDKPVPLQAKISKFLHGQTPSEDVTSNVQIDYVFFQNYLTDRDRSVFQIPSEMYCDGRKPSKPIPNIPNHFRFRSEYLVTRLKEVGEYDEWYNQENKIVRIDTKPLPGNMALLDLSTRTKILDFNSGISFLISQNTGMCEVTPIMPEDFNSKLVDANHVQIKSPQEFFHFDSGNFIYAGKQTSVRGISTETWIGKRNDFPTGCNCSSTWIWYFSTDEWAVSQFGEPLKNVPVLLKIDLPEKDLHFSYNIYDFSPKDPDLVDFDVSSCYKQSDLRHIEFSLIGNTQLASKLPKTFKYEMIKALKTKMAVSILRITDIQVDFYDHGANVIFTLLDPANFTGDVAGVSDLKALTSSSDAVKSLERFLNLGSVFLHFRVDNVNGRSLAVIFISSPHSLDEVVIYPSGPTVSSSSSTAKTTPGTSSTPLPTTKVSPTQCVTVNGHVVESPDQQWTSKSVAGLSVGLIVCGIFVGTVMTFLISRYKLKGKFGKDSSVENGTLAYSMM